jgi:hypothetical protein
VFFTTPELLEIGGLPLVTPYDKPTRLEALRYYRRVVDTYDLQISFHERVTSIERESDSRFIVETESDRGHHTSPGARAIVLAIGYYDLPNYLAFLAKTCRTSPLLHRRATRTIAGASSLLAARTRGRGEPRAVSRRRARAHSCTASHARRFNQVLGKARHREPHQGGVDRRAFNACVREITRTTVVIDHEGLVRRFRDGVFP